MKTVCANIAGANIRVKHAQLFAMSSFFTTMCPTVQQQYHAEIIPTLLGLFEGQHVKIQAGVAFALQSFVSGFNNEADEDEDEGVKNPRDTLKMYAADILKAMCVLLKQAIQSNYEALQSKVLDTIMTIAEVIESDFAPFYNDFVPMMLEILQKVEASSDDNKRLRARAIETTGVIVGAVTECEESAALKESVQQITQFLANAVNQGFSDADPQDLASKEALINCAGFLGTEFAVYMPVLMDTIVRDSQLSLDFKMQSADQPVTDTNAGFNVKVNLIKGMGEQRVSMNTENLVRKTGAFALLEQVSEKMGSSFAPYVEPLAPIVMEHMKFQFHHEIRKHALKTFANMLVAVGEPLNVQLFQQAFQESFVAETLKEITRKKTKTVKLLVKSLVLCLKKLSEQNVANREFLSQAQICSLAPVIKGSLDLVVEMRAALQISLAQSKKAYDLDEEDLEIMKEDIAKISKVAS